jgi:hypothetical protein
LEYLARSQPFNRLTGGRTWRCFTAPRGVSGWAVVASGSRLYFDASRLAFTLHAADITSWVNRDDLFRPASYTCAYQKCTSVGNQDISIDQDGNGYTTWPEGLHFNALLFGC